MLAKTSFPPLIAYWCWWHQAEWIHAVNAKFYPGHQLVTQQPRNCWTGWSFSTLGNPGFGDDLLTVIGVRWDDDQCLMRCIWFCVSLFYSAVLQCSHDYELLLAWLHFIIVFLNINKPFSPSCVSLFVHIVFKYCFRYIVVQKTLMLGVLHIWTWQNVSVFLGLFEATS